MDSRSILKKFEIDCNLIKDIDDYELLEIKPGIKVKNDQFYDLMLIKNKNTIVLYILQYVCKYCI